MKHSIDTNSWLVSIRRWSQKTPQLMSVADDILERCVDRVYIKSSNPESLEFAHGEYLLDAFSRVNWQCFKHEHEFKKALSIIDEQAISACDLSPITGYMADLGARNYFVYPLKNQGMGAYLASASIALGQPEMRVFNAILDESVVSQERLEEWAIESGFNMARVFRATPEDFVKSMVMNTEINTFSSDIAKIKTTCVLGMDEKTFRDTYMPIKGVKPTERVLQAAFKPRRRDK